MLSFYQEITKEERKKGDLTVHPSTSCGRTVNFLIYLDLLWKIALAHYLKHAL